MSASERATELALAAAQAAADKLAHDILLLDVSEQLVITDVFLLASAPSDRQVKAVVDAIEDALRELGATVQAVDTDLATEEGVDELYGAVNGRAVDALLANAGHGLGKAFLDQDWDGLRHVIGTNVTGAVYLVHRTGRTMRCARSGRSP